MNTFICEQSALILIDIQQAFNDISYWGEDYNNPEAIDNAGKILRLWRKNNLPIVHIRHCSVNPDSPFHITNSGNKFMDAVMPMDDETVICKYVNSAFIGTNLQQLLQNNSISKLVIAGLTTDHCVSTTVRMAGNFGFEVYLVSDATAAFGRTDADGKYYTADLIHHTALASLNKEFAQVVTTASIIQHV